MENQVSKKILQQSALLGLAMSLFSIGFGIFTTSQMIMFDGVYALVSVGLTYLSIFAASFIDIEDQRRYPFGKAALEPLVVIVQYSILLFLSITNILIAIQNIFDGGHEMDFQAGLIYAVISMIGCGIIYLKIKRDARNSNSALADVEVVQWKFSVMFSTVVLLAFAIGFFISGTSLNWITFYIDSSMVIFITLFFIRKPLIETGGAVKELMSAIPYEELNDKITTIVENVTKSYDARDTIIRIAKVGGQLIVEVDFVIEPEGKLDSVVVQDGVRKKLSESLSVIQYNKWLSISFTADKKWTE